MRGFINALVAGLMLGFGFHYTLKPQLPNNLWILFIVLAILSLLAGLYLEFQEVSK